MGGLPHETSRACLQAVKEVPVTAIGASTFNSTTDHGSYTRTDPSCITDLDPELPTWRVLGIDLLGSIRRSRALRKAI